MATVCTRRQSWDVAVAVLGVTIIVYLWVSSHVYVFVPWIEISWDEHRAGWTLFLATVNVLAAMSLWSFIMAAITNPGTVPSNYKSATLVDSPLRMRHLRWCRKCETVKPPRTHHCRHGCESCVLKMDHHCPWIANCVGFRNHGHFVRYVVYTWLTAVVAAVALCYRIFQMIWTPQAVYRGAIYVGKFHHHCRWC